MADRHVIVLEVVVDGHLPVALPGADPGLVDELHLLQAVGPRHLDEVAPHLRQARARAAHAHEHESQQNLQLNRLQPELGLVDAGERLLRRHGGQPPVEPVGPAVIRAGDAGAAGAGAVQQSRAAMPAGVGEGADHAILAAHHDDGIAHHVERGEGARRLQLIDVADELPGRPDQLLVFERGQLGIEIGPGRQAAHEAGVACGRQGRALLVHDAGLHVCYALG